MSKQEMTQEQKDKQNFEIGALLDIYAVRYNEKHGHYPLIHNQEKYEHFGEWCSIIESNVYSTIKDAEVVIESRSGERHEIALKELSWNFHVLYGRKRDETNFITEKQIADALLKDLQAE